MRVELKNLNPVRKQLADGTWVTYWYAWKSGPRVHGVYGSPEFIASYNEAVAGKKATVGNTLSSLTAYFQTTTEFTNGISERTRSDYLKQIALIDN
jgi:hypothetical protein